MRFATILPAATPDTAAFGPVVDDHVLDVSRTFASPADALRLDRRAELDAAASVATRVPLAGCRFLPPVPAPTRILCIGVNYAAHAAESDRPSGAPYPTVFTRFPSSVVGHGEPIIRPHVSDRFDYEGELVVVIGRTGRYITRERALDHVAGYSCFNDGTLRDYQRHTTQFVPGKTFDRSGSFGPWVVTADEIADPSTLVLTTTLNGEQMQHAPTSDLIHDVPALIAYCSEFTTLEPGDLIVTGTPGGVGYARTPPVFMVPGDVVEVTITGIGTLGNTVADET